MKVDRLMTRDLVTVAGDETLKVAARLMVERKISGLPVVDSDRRLVGVVTEGDILHQETLRNPSTTFRGLFRRAGHFSRIVSEVMTTRVVTTSPDADHTEAARLMESAGVKRLPVVATEGSLVGIISRSDVLKVFGRPDSEIKEELYTEVIERILWLNSQMVTVSVQDGQVALTGEVPARSDTRILEEMAKRVDGVIGVEIGGLSFDVDDTRRPG
ncbi:MAG TPA: CBS domain-containing protein [Acidimicrobiia bacterium]